MLNPRIFRANDIRGVVGEELTDKVAEQIGIGFGTFVRQSAGKMVFVGYDNRPSSPDLSASLIEGLLAAGCDVQDIGMVPTPLVYFASTRTPASFGVAITGSHLGSDANGFKFCHGNQSLHKEQIEHIRELTGTYQASMENERGVHCAAGAVIGEYIQYFSDLYHRKPSMKIVVDCQNGATSILAPKIFETIGISVDCLHCDLTGPYPFGRPDPQITGHLSLLRRRVIETKAAIGLAFDGDGDRLGVVDDQGNHVAADRIVALLSRQVLSRTPGAKVIYDVLSSQVLADEVNRCGGTPIACESGHSFIKECMHREGAMLAGEYSGHIFFADDYYGYDDAIYAACRLVEFLTDINEPLSQLNQELPTMHSWPEERPPCPDEKKHRIVAEVKQEYEREGYSLLTTESSVKVFFENGWGLIRVSNTEPVVSLRFEATTEEALTEYRRIGWNHLITVGKQHQLHFRESRAEQISQAS